MLRQFALCLILVTILIIPISSCNKPPADTDQTNSLVSETDLTEPQYSSTEQDAITILVKNENGDGLAGARICSIDPLTMQTQTAWSDQAGQAVLAGSDGPDKHIVCSVPGYFTKNIVIKNDEVDPINFILKKIPAYKPWLLAFSTRTKDAKGRIYLAQSPDGINWELTDDKFLFEAPLPAGKTGSHTYTTEAYESLVVTMSPDVIMADGRPRVYFDQYFLYPDPIDGWIRKTINQDPGNWNPDMQMIDLNTFGFFDYQVSVVDHDGMLLLMGKNRLGYGYSDLGITMGVGASVDAAVFGYASAVEGSMGQVFNCPEDRYLLNINDQYGFREPDWIKTDHGSYMIVTAPDGLRIFRSDELTGSYSRDSHLLYAEQGLAGCCVDYSPDSGKYTIFISRLNQQSILSAQLASWTETLTDDDFKVVIDATILPEEEQNIVFLGNPGTCFDSDIIWPQADPTGPFQISLASPRNRSFNIGLGSTSYMQVAEDEQISVSMTCGENNQGNSAGLLPVSLFSDFAVSAQVILPDDPDAMGGLSYCWQDEGEYMGGYCLRISKHKWDVIHVKPGRYFTGTYLVPISNELITPIASGNLEEPFIQGRLSVVLASGEHFFYLDGKLLGQTVMRPQPITEYLIAEPLLVGYPGFYVRAVRDGSIRTTISDFQIIDIRGQYHQIP